MLFWVSLSLAPPVLAPEIPIPHLCFLLWSIHFNQSYLCSFGTIHWSLVKIHQWIYTSRPWRTLSWDPLVINTSAGRNWGLCTPHYPWLTEDSVQQAQCLDLQLLWGYNCSNAKDGILQTFPLCFGSCVFFCFVFYYLPWAKTGFYVAHIWCGSPFFVLLVNE